MNRENAEKLLKKYRDKHESNCSVCKYLGLFISNDNLDYSLVCRNFKFMTEKEYLGNVCGCFEEDKDLELF